MTVLTVENVVVKPDLVDVCASLNTNGVDGLAKPCGFGTPIPDATLYWAVVAAEHGWHVVRLVSFTKRCAVQTLMQSVGEG
eukprot:4468208-Amphidinium_carterae.1